MAPEPRRISLVTDELLGYTRTGGIGTATSFLALALGRMGHRVELLYASDPPTTALGAEWGRLYAEAGVSIRILTRSDTQVEPSYFGRMRDVERTLAADPPDVVITQDLAAPAYTAIRLRSLGLGFEDTLFVVYCHGTRQWITDVARKVRVLPGALGITLLEQASIELADVVISPSAYLVDWMRQQSWRLPTDTRVIPHITRAVATREPQARAEVADGHVRRLAFFGRLEERKGIRPFIAGLNALPADLLEHVEVEFVGRPTPAWTAERVQALLSEHVRKISFAPDLDQPEALARLARPGTLVVMPSFAETFGNTVRECLDYGIPFIASNAGAIPELIAAEDQPRVLFEPTADGVATALRRALTNGDALRPARAAFNTSSAAQGWAEVVEQEPARPHPEDASAEGVVLLHEGDVPDEDLVETLTRAQAVSGADVVTCGIRVDGMERFFLGDPGGLGLLANHYGTVALVRRSLLTATEEPWHLLARLVLDGAKIVSVPRALAAAKRSPGDVDTDPATALRVIALFERRLPDGVKALGRLAAGLAAASPERQSVARNGFVRRAARAARRRIPQRA